MWDSLTRFSMWADSCSLRSQFGAEELFFWRETSRDLQQRGLQQRGLPRFNKFRQEAVVWA